MSERRQEKRQAPLGDGPDERRAWIVHGREASVEFWIILYADSEEDRSGYTDGVHQGRPYSVGGFEIHSRKPLYEGHEQRQGVCQALGGPCWHDGSSTQAVEFAATWQGSDEQVFEACAGRLGESRS